MQQVGLETPPIKKDDPVAHVVFSDGTRILSPECLENAHVGSQEEPCGKTDSSGKKGECHLGGWRQAWLGSQMDACGLIGAKFESPGRRDATDSGASL